jgi:hypothetical protein
MSATPREMPRKQPGQGLGPRLINGACLDLRSTSMFMGFSEKKLRGMVERRMIPFTRVGGRIVFIKSALEHWLSELDGCSVEEALKNLEQRRGEGT